MSNIIIRQTGKRSIAFSGEMIASQIKEKHERHELASYFEEEETDGPKEWYNLSIYQTSANMLILRIDFQAMRNSYNRDFTEAFVCDSIETLIHHMETYNPTAKTFFAKADRRAESNVEALYGLRRQYEEAVNVVLDQLPESVLNVD